MTRTRSGWSKYYRRIGRIRLRLNQVKAYPKWVAEGSNYFFYCLNDNLNSWVESVRRTSDGYWHVGQVDRRFEDLEEALQYGEELARPKIKTPLGKTYRQSWEVDHEDIALR